MSSRKSITWREAVYRVLKERGSPMTLAEITREALKIKPSKAKRPEVSVRNTLNYEIWAIYLGKEGWALPAWLLKGCLFRCTPRFFELRGGYLLTTIRMAPFFINYPSRPPLRFMDEKGKPVPTPLLNLGGYEAIALSHWYRDTGFELGDSIIVEVVDAEEGRYRLIREAQKDKKRDLVKKYNQELADAVLAFLTSPTRRYRDEFLCRVIPTVLPRMPFAKEYPPDDYLDLFAMDKRIRLLEAQMVAPADFRRPLDMLWESVQKDFFWGLNPGYIGPLEEPMPPFQRDAAINAILEMKAQEFFRLQEEAEFVPERGEFVPQEHWIELKFIDIVEMELEKGLLVFRFQFDSALGFYISADEVAITEPEKMAERTLSLIRSRYRTLVRVNLLQNPSPLEMLEVELGPEDALKRLTGFFANFVEALEAFKRGTLSEREIRELSEEVLDFEEEEEEGWWELEE